MQPSMSDWAGEGVGLPPFVVVWGLWDEEADLCLIWLMALISCIVSGMLFVDKNIGSRKANVKQIVIRVYIKIAIENWPHNGYYKRPWVDI